jgi:uncharacterized membrane protein YeaQ/YmgE (transglycosylase-associated protein family)
VILFVFLLLVVLFVVLPLIWHVFWLVVWAAISGLFFGALGRLIVPGRNPIGFAATVVCGWIGSLLGLAVGHGLLHRGRFITVLLEAGAAAVAVALWSGTQRRSVGGSPRALGRR